MYKSIIEEAKAKGIATEKIMWDSVADVEAMLAVMREEHEDMYWAFIKKTHRTIFGPHYNENFAEWRIKQMYYKDKSGNVHRAPHWSKEEHRAAYEAVKAKLPASYNMYDFAVTLEMLWSDDICLFRMWWPEAPEAQLEGKVVEAAVNYLNDADAEDGKIWHRFEV